MEKIKKSELRGLLKDKSSETIIKESFCVFIPTRKSICEKIILFSMMIIPSYLSSHSYNTVVLFGDISEILLNVFIALLGIVFTGFIFFQALLNDELLLVLVSTKDQKNGKIKLEEININFVKLMMLYIVAVGVSLLLTIAVPCIPQDFMLFENEKICNAIAWLLIQIFYLFTAELIWRIVSFIRNIYQLFNAYAVSRIVKLVEVVDDEEIEPQND